LAVYDGFEPAIGLEVHAQLQTATKIFCGCKAAYGAPPNSLTCPVCLGLPGALPTLNKKAVEFAAMMILAVGGTVHRRSSFARKNYFYPDLPKGYQISQYEQPVGGGGSVAYQSDNGSLGVCRLSGIHLEEDAGKLLHGGEKEGTTRIDLNRCGVPLIEIVSEADLRSPDDAYSYLLKLKQLLQYVEVCSGDMEKGHLRCDANVSVRAVGQEGYGTRTELKNMNSFKAVRQALRFEIDRQIDLLKAGGKVKQVTLLWNENARRSEVMRSKELSQDYRYFPEPDLPAVEISEAWLDGIRRALPELPDARASRFVLRYAIREYDAAVLTGSRSLADFFEAVMQYFDDGRAAANWILTVLLGGLREAGQEIDACRVRPAQFDQLLDCVKDGRVSGTAARQVLAEMIQTGSDPAAIIETKALGQISDPDRLLPVVDRVLARCDRAVREYRAGKTAALKYLIGQVIRETDGRARPETVNDLLGKRLKE